MSDPNRNQPSRRRRPQGQKRNRPQDLWRPVPLPDAPEPITPAEQPTALLESLGTPPLRGQSAAEHYLATVVQRAAALATALAASADLLAEPGDD